MTIDALDTPASELLGSLESVLGGYAGLVVAFSGGVDSAVLLAAAHRVLGSRTLALTTDSPSLPRAELAAACDIALRLGVEHVVVPTAELEREEYTRNDERRCYVCKQTLFETCRRIARERGVADIAYGYTLDDAGDYRPGAQAAAESAIRAPLFDAGLGKREIRAIALHLGLEVWDKPAAPCLSSRIPYGSEVTVAKLSDIEQMETLLHALGFAVCRARYDGTTMRLELDPKDIAHAAQPRVRTKILALAAELGTPLVTLDLEGFKSGKLNRGIGR